MEDIESLMQFTPEEHARFEKEQNVYSIIKTIEFLVSHHTEPFLGLTVAVCRSLRTCRAK